MYGEMENLLLESIRHIKEVSRKRVSLDRITSRIKKAVQQSWIINLLHLKLNK